MKSSVRAAAIFFSALAFASLNSCGSGSDSGNPSSKGSPSSSQSTDLHKLRDAIDYYADSPLTDELYEAFAATTVAICHDTPAQMVATLRGTQLRTGPYAELATDAYTMVAPGQHDFSGIEGTFTGLLTDAVDYLCPSRSNALNKASSKWMFGDN